jgi:hypothetical protein
MEPRSVRFWRVRLLRLRLSCEFERLVEITKSLLPSRLLTGNARAFVDCRGCVESLDSVGIGR